MSGIESVAGGHADADFGGTAAPSNRGLPLSLPARVVARLQASLFIFGALLGSAWLVRSGPQGSEREIMAALAVTYALVGVVAWVAPPHRWVSPGRASLTTLLFVLLATAQGAVSSQPSAFALFSMLGFVWVGLMQKRGTSIKMSPLLGGACLVVLAGGNIDGAIVFEAVMGVIVTVVIGETIAWVMALLRKSNAKLRGREAWFRSLVQNSSDIVTVAAPDTTISFLSASIGSILGHSPEALLGSKLLSLVHPDDVSKVWLRAPNFSAMVRPAEPSPRGGEAQMEPGVMSRAL